jgi:ABC-type polysaccharide/polyol phosphate transport system ATPase subunit
MNNTIVKVNSLSKYFSLKPVSQNKEGIKGLLKCFLGIDSHSPKIATHKDEHFWALKDISFEISRGECLGIVGMNGAGKSTLLKVLLNRLSPDEGTIEISGQTGGLIELGAGFHEELSGRDNIIINASLLGKKKSEIENQIDSIINFADIGTFIDSPVKSYSSGMRIRLGFSIAIHFVTDLVICDEILAVGDFEFRQKCYLKLSELKENRSFILVSHSPADIRNFCDRAILLHNGELIAEGSPDYILNCYSHCEHKINAKQLRKRIFGIKRPKSNIDTTLVKKPNPKTIAVIQNRKDKVLSHEQKETILGKEYLNSDYIKTFNFSWNIEKKNDRYIYLFPNSIQLSVSFELIRSCSNFQIGVPFRDEDGKMILGPSNTSEKIGLKPGFHSIEIEIDKIPFYHGRLWPLIALSDMPGFILRKYLPYIDIHSDTKDYGWAHCDFDIKYNIKSEIHPFESTDNNSILTI